jgi:uncharacterized membrane protein YccF (DUF307 family)
MNLLGKIIWLLFGGLVTAIGYIFGGLILCLTIIGIPFGLQCFKLAPMVLMPFGKQVVTNENASRPSRLILNIIWILFGGLWIALGHVLMGLILFITIIGIPFGKQHFKLIEISLMPFGKEVI